MTVNVLMPTLGMKGTAAVDSLVHAPFEVNVIQSSVNGWAAAMNDCLTRRVPGDCLIMDDDVLVLPHTFDLLEQHYNDADVFGFRLLYPDGRLQHDGGYVTPVAGAGHIFDDGQQPTYTQYVTASLCYVKAHVFDQVPAFNEWPGVQWEDVAFCLDAWRAGLRVLYLPGEAIHEETGTKRADTRLSERFGINAVHFGNKYRRQCREINDLFGHERRLPLGH